MSAVAELLAYLIVGAVLVVVGWELLSIARTGEGLATRRLAKWRCPGCGYVKAGEFGRVKVCQNRRCDRFLR